MSGKKLQINRPSEFLLELTSLAVAGGLLGSVFAIGLTAWVIPFLLLPLFHSLLKPVKLAPKDALVRLCYFFIPFFVVVLSWSVTVYLGSVIVSQGTTSLIEVSSLVTVSSAWTAVSLLLALACFRIRKSQRPVLTAAWLLPSAWVICEWLRSVAASVLFAGPSGSIGDYWNLGSLGLAAINTPIAGLSRYVGMYGLSFIMVLIAVLLYYSLFKRAKAAGVSLAILLLAGGAFSWLALLGPQHQAAVLHGSVLQQQAEINGVDDPGAVDNRSGFKKNLIVLPEYSEVFAAGNESFGNAVNTRLSIKGVSINVGTIYEGQNRYGALEFRDKAGKKLQVYKKQLLIPSGEYLPWLLKNQLDLTGHRQAVKDFELYHRLYRGQSPTLFSHGGLNVGSVACSGILGRDIYRHLTEDGAQVLTNSANLLIFRGSQSYLRQSLMMAKFHAVANDRTFIQATQGAPSFVIGPDGRYIVRPDGDDTKFIDFNFQPSNDKTLYTRIGDWPLWLSGLALAVYALRSFPQKRFDK